MIILGVFCILFTLGLDFYLTMKIGDWLSDKLNTDLSLHFGVFLVLFALEIGIIGQILYNNGMLK